MGGRERRVLVMVVAVRMVLDARARQRAMGQSSDVWNPCCAACLCACAS